MLLRFALTPVVCLALLGTLPSPVRTQEVKPDPRATSDYAIAVGLQDKQLYTEAAQRWRKFLQDHTKDPRLANAHHHLGVCLLREKQYAAAAVAFAEVQVKFPKFDALDASAFNRGLALYNLGLTTKKAEDLRVAARAFAEVPAKFAKSKHAAAALYYQGESLYQAGDVADSLAPYAKAIAEHPGSDVLADVYYALGTAQQQLGRHKDAAQTFAAFVKKSPAAEQANECRLRLGQCLFKDKQFLEAGRTFEALVQLAGFPYADFALMQQAQCHYEQGQFVQAAALFEGLPRKFARSKYIGASLVAAGKCWFQGERHLQAQTALTAVFDQKLPEAPEAAYWLGQTLLKLKKPAEAMTAVEKAIAAYPASEYLPQLAYLRITALHEQPQRRKESVAQFADFARKYPDSDLAGRALYLAALTALQGDDLPTARNHAQTFLATPKFARSDLVPEVLFLGGESCLRAAPPDHVKAEPLYRRLLTEYPKHPQAPQAQLRVGLCLYFAKKHAESLALLTLATKVLKDPVQVAESQLLIARNLIDTGKKPAAREALEKALQAKADWEQGDIVLLLLADCCRSENRLAEANTHLKRLAAAYPKSPHRAQALLDLGGMAQEQKQYDEALRQYEQLAAQSPGTDLGLRALHGIGMLQFSRKEYARAIEAFGKQLAGPADHALAPRARYMRGLSHHRLGQFEQGAKELTAFLASKPPEKDALDARYALGLCQVSLKQYDQAAATFTALLKDKPTYEQADRAAYELSFALLAAKKNREAAEAFRQLAARHPGSPLAAESLFRAGELHENAREWAEAALAYSSGLDSAKAGDMREKLQYKLGWVHYRRDKFAEAATILQAQIKEHPRGELLSDATYLAGECHFQLNRFREALPLFEQIVQSKAPKFLARSLYRCGACCGNLDQWPASQKHYETLIAGFADFEQVQEARYGVAWALQNQGKLEEARVGYEQITKAVTTETAAKSRFMIGECAFKQKKHREAIEHFLAAALGYPYEEWQVLGQFEAGRCFLELKDTKRALDCFETITKKHPKHARATDAARYIADLRK